MYQTQNGTITELLHKSKRKMLQKNCENNWKSRNHEMKLNKKCILQINDQNVFIHNWKENKTNDNYSHKNKRSLKHLNVFYGVGQKSELKTEEVCLEESQVKHEIWFCLRHKNLTVQIFTGINKYSNAYKLRQRSNTRG